MERRTKSYLQLMKPGITLSNTIAAMSGFFLAASMLGFDPKIFIGVTIGVALVIASACVVNNIIDRDIDAKMKRTQKREVASGNISISNAILYAVALGTGGFLLLFVWTNLLTTVLGVISYVWYVVIYGIAKRTTPLSTIIGGVCGALPPVAGYTALTNQIDIVAVLLFAMMMVWQMPHFYAVAIFRRDEYAAAKLPVWAVRYGSESARRQMIVWILAFLALAPMLAFTGAVHDAYLLIMVTTGVYWVVQAIGYPNETDKQWAWRIFKSSIIVLLVMSLSVALGGYLI